MINKITKSGYLVIRIITAVIMTVFLIYSLFTLWDMFRTEINAFASYDLLKYRPDIEHDKPPYLDELLKINPDTAGWVTVYGTNIDYPVMKGKDDNEYLNKSPTGDFSISGSIFMSCLNKKDFSDPYIMLYGHHMANGSMFGDIEKFKKDKAFFYNRKNKRYKKDEGVLIMQNKVWNLKVFAVMETDAYNNIVYRSDKTQSELYDFIDYAKKHSKYYINVKNIDKVLAMSTCDSATTDGRTVLLCSMKMRTEPLPTREAEPLTPHRKALGHPMAGAYWSVLNLLCMLATVFFTIKFLLVKEIRSKIKNKEKRVLIFTLANIFIMLGSVILFILTEDLHKPFQMTDIWTPCMLIILVGAYVVDKFLLRRAK